MMKNLRRYATWTLVVMLLLGGLFAVQAQNVGAIKQSAKAAKISPDLYQVMQNNGPLPIVSTNGGTVETNQVFVNNKVAIEAVASTEDGQGLLNELKALGLTDGVAYKRKIFGYLPIDKIGELKNVSSLLFADSYYRPETNTGSVTSQGDAALKADIARTTYGVTGAGVKVGILSDSYNRLNGQAAGIASNDLPAAGVQVLQELPAATTGATDEGRAMAEIIYDVAPGAAMAFNTAFTGEAGFATGIINLAGAGCQIIVDDIGYLNAPMFQDGLVAQAVDQVVAGGATYFSAAANQARSSYQAPYKNGGTYTNAGFYGTSSPFPTHDFGSGGVDNLQQITIPTGGSLRLAFQWDNPYQSISGGTGATTDLDILILNSTTGAILASGARDQSAGGDPWEITGTYTNTSGAPLNVNVIIVKYSGPDPGLIKWVNYGSRTIVPEYDTKSSTSFGHANAAGAIGVGAAAYFQTPVFNGASTATIEGFSSAGGTPILFNTNGTRINGITGTVRQKPEITSVDGGDNTFFGQDFDSNGKPNFFGTSAAAPHAAGVAALMKQKVPAITRNTILSTLQSTALDMDDPSTAGFDAGFDFGTGYGFIQADKALQALSPTSLSLVVSANPTMLTTSGTTTLSATVSGGTTPYSYTFSGPGTITPSGNTASVSGLPAGVQTFTVVARDATAPTSQSISGTVSVTVTQANTAPTVANAVPPQSATVGVAYTLSLANVFTDVETPSSLTLSVSSLPAGLNFSPPSTISGTPSASGVSSVTVTATDPGSLTASNTFSITVSPAAVVVTPLALTFTASPTMILTTGTTTLSATVSGGTTPYSYTFSGPGTITPSGNTASVSGLLAGVQTFTVVARDATAPTSQSISGTVSVTVTQANTAPTVANAVPPQSATVGVAYTLSLATVFTDAETPSSLTLSVSSLPAGLNFSPPSTISGTPSASGVTSVTVTATDPGSLTASTSFSITVSPAPVVVTPLALTFTASPTMILTTGTTTLSATVSGGTTPYSYTFSGPGTITPSGNTASVSGLPAGVQTFTVVARDATAPTSQSISGTVSVTVTQANTAPTVANAVPPQSATVGVAYTLSLANVFTDAETPSSLTLSVSGLPAGLSFVPPATISGNPSVSGVSSVTVKATDPGSLTASNIFSITVSPAPVVVVPPSSQTVCRSSVVVLNAATMGVRYEWYKNGTSAPFKLTEIASIQKGTATSSLTAVSVQTTASYYCKVFAANGSFVFDGPFKVTVDYGCTTPGARLASESVAEVPLSVVLTPNPLVDGQLRALVRGAAGQALSAELVDVSGRTVKAQVWPVADAEQVVAWDVTARPSGMYILRVQAGEQRQTLKVVKPD